MTALKSELDTLDGTLKQTRIKQLDVEIFIDRYMPSQVISLIYDSFKSGDLFTESVDQASRTYVHVHNLRRSFLLRMKQLYQKINRKIKDEELDDRLAFNLKNPMKRMCKFTGTFSFAPKIEVPKAMVEDESSHSDSESETEESDEEQSEEQAEQ